MQSSYPAGLRSSHKNLKADFQYLYGAKSHMDTRNPCQINFGEEVFLGSFVIAHNVESFIGTKLMQVHKGHIIAQRETKT